MRTLQIIACPCGKIKAFGDWRWNDVEFSRVMSIIFEDGKMNVGENFFLVVRYELCDHCEEEKQLKGGDG
jgi:hypothetical protein